MAELGWLGSVYDEHTGNLGLQQWDLRASGKAGITLGKLPGGAYLPRSGWTLGTALLNRF